MIKSPKNVLIIVGIIVIGLILFFAGSAKTSQPSATQASNVISSQQLKFADTPDAQHAYLISVDSYDATTSLALAGFSVGHTILADGSRQYTLVAQNPEYKNQTYIVKTGQKLYFIERMLGDDSDNEERNVRDDSAVLVDAGGFVVQQ
jgi:hypothetical protein